MLLFPNINILFLKKGFDGQMTADNTEIGLCNEAGFTILNVITKRLLREYSLREPQFCQENIYYFKIVVQKSALLYYSYNIHFFCLRIHE